jgi:hypothetical protein
VDVTGLGADVSTVSTGFRYSCAVMTTGAVKCWGDNVYGMLGDGTNTSSSLPVDVQGLASGVAEVSAGGYHVCALTLARGVKCWGENDAGQLGDGTTINRSTPVDVLGLATAVMMVRAGTEHTCAVTAVGAVKCWGYNFYGQLGDGSSQSSAVPVDVPKAAGEVGSGGFHSCAVATAGGLSCWGSNSSGQLGDGTRTNRNAPAAVYLDSDGDGCADVREGQTATGSQLTGGLRNQKSFWDFFDVPTGSDFTRDRSITAQDTLAVLSRFGSVGNPGIDPLSFPSPPPAYHSAYDRAPSLGPHAWNIRAANGTIAVTDVFAGIAQFGHSCE